MHGDDSDSSSSKNSRQERKSNKTSPLEEHKPRIVLTFRSEKSGAKSSNMKIVSNEDKNEDVSPRRSSRARSTKYESDDEEFLLSRKEKSVSENDESSDGSSITTKRSVRCKSKETNSILTNTIVQKEKSFNISSLSMQRPPRRIKPTAKVLANKELEFRTKQNSDKSLEDGVKTRRSARRKSVEITTIDISRKSSKRKKEVVNDEDDDSNDDDYIKIVGEDPVKPSSAKKIKHVQAIHSDEENDDTEERNEEVDEEYEIDEGEEEEDDDDDTEVISKLIEADGDSSVSDGFVESDEEFLCTPSESGKSKRPNTRRSTRQYTSYVDQTDEDRFSPTPEDDDKSHPRRRSTRLSKNVDSYTTEPDSAVAGGDEGSEATCPDEESGSVTATCYCEVPSKYCAAPSMLTEPVFCQAIETVDGIRVGCSHLALKEKDGSYAPMVRAGPRTPFILACGLHNSNLREHMCCPACGLFCSQGLFYLCSERHLFHAECGIPYGDNKQQPGCPHCGVTVYRWQPVNRQCTRVKVEMHSANKRTYLPDQRLQFTPAYLGFTLLEEAQLNQQPVIPADLIPSHDIEQLDAVYEESECVIEEICDAILEGETWAQLAPKFNLSMDINKPLDFLVGGTCVHAAAKSGNISALYLLHYKGANLDAVDNKSRTPLMVAILELLERDDKNKLKNPVLKMDCGDQATDEIKDEQNKVISNTEKEICEKNDELSDTKNEISCATKNEDQVEVGECSNVMDVDQEQDTGTLIKNDDKEIEINIKQEHLIKSESKTSEEGCTKGDEEVLNIKTEVQEETQITIDNESSARPSDEDLLRVISFLVAAGCNVNHHGPDESTALHIAAHHGSNVVCSIILSSANAEIDPRDDGGWTPLVWAAEYQHNFVLSYLVRHGADASTVDNEGNGAIHWCALGGSARCLQLLLDAAPNSINTVNINGDTALHISAREGNISCVLILLARGAKTDIKNKAGQIPVEVSEGECQSAIAFTMHMRCRSEISKLRILSNDISNGRETHPIPCVNEVDDEQLPSDFKYVTNHVFPYPLTIENTIESLQGCACTDGDCSTSCACSLLSVRQWWARGRLVREFPYRDPPMLFECNQSCSCSPKLCTNSVLTRAIRSGSMLVRATVFRTEGGRRGWGLMTSQHVLRGTPVATYCGELLTAERADTRRDDHYVFALELKPNLLEQCSEKTQLCVDAFQYGSAARFINHSCRPNLVPVRVFVATRDLRLPTVVLFAATDIHAGAELTFDYGDKFWSVKSKWMKCECGTPECRYPTKTKD